MSAPQSEAPSARPSMLSLNIKGKSALLSADETGVSARRKIENLLGNAPGSTRQTHTL